MYVIRKQNICPKKKRELLFLQNFIQKICLISLPFSNKSWSKLYEEEKYHIYDNLTSRFGKQNISMSLYSAIEASENFFLSTFKEIWKIIWMLPAAHEPLFPVTVQTNSFSFVSLQNLSPQKQAASLSAVPSVLRQASQIMYPFLWKFEVAGRDLRI